MAKLKHIKRIYESEGSVEIVSIKDRDVTLINPAGIKVTVHMEPDGEIDEWIERPYTKTVSVSGDDGTYEYYMGALTDEHESYFEIEDDEIDYKTLEQVEKDKIESKRISAEHHKRWKAEVKRKKAIRDAEIKASGLSEEDFLKRERFEEAMQKPSIIEADAKIGKDFDRNVDYLFAKLTRRHYDRYDNTVEYYDDYIKVPHKKSGLDILDDDDSFVTGTDDPMPYKKDLYDKGILVKGNIDLENIEIIKPDVKNDPNNYVGQLPYYSQVDFFIED